MTTEHVGLRHGLTAVLVLDRAARRRQGKRRAADSGHDPQCRCVSCVAERRRRVANRRKR